MWYEYESVLAALRSVGIETADGSIFLNSVLTFADDV